MRLFMNAGASPGYLNYFGANIEHGNSYGSRKKGYLNDRFGGAHFLGPVLDSKDWAAFTIGNDWQLQQMWAAEHGMSSAATQEDVLLAQLEDHRADVFYNLDPLRFGSSFIRRLPGCVRVKLCWRAAPSPGADFGAYDRVMCNFQGIRELWRKMGYRTAAFFPAHDPAMDKYSANTNRPIDVCFVGGYSRHHRTRESVLNAVAECQGTFRIRYHLDVSRLTRIAEWPLMQFSPLRRLRRPPSVKAISRGPLFGQRYYELLSRSKIVLNGSIDMAGGDRGNMRCFEAMGSGSVLVSDHGSYPNGMLNGHTMLTYKSPENALAAIRQVLTDWPSSASIGEAARQMVRTEYSKEKQWDEFLNIVGEVCEIGSSGRISQADKVCDH